MPNRIFRNGYAICTEYEKMHPFNCPVSEVTRDGIYVGSCEFYLKDGMTCPRHGIVKEKGEFGAPYSVAEARLVAEDPKLKKYFKNIILWLCDCLDKT